MSAGGHEKGPPEYLPAAQPGSKFIRSQTLLSPRCSQLAPAVKSKKLFRLRNKRSRCNDVPRRRAVSLSTPVAFSLSMFERCEVRPL